MILIFYFDCCNSPCLILHPCRLLFHSSSSAWVWPGSSASSWWYCFVMNCWCTNQLRNSLGLVCRRLFPGRRSGCEASTALLNWSLRWMVACHVRVYVGDELGSFGTSAPSVRFDGWFTGNCSCFLSLWLCICLSLSDIPLCYSDWSFPLSAPKVVGTADWRFSVCPSVSFHSRFSRCWFFSRSGHFLLNFDFDGIGCRLSCAGGSSAAGLWRFGFVRRDVSSMVGLFRHRWLIIEPTQAV